MKRVFKNPKLRSELERDLPEFVWNDVEEAIALRGLLFYRLQKFLKLYRVLRTVQTPKQLKHRRQFMNRIWRMFTNMGQVLTEGYGFSDIKGLVVPEVVRKRVEDKFDNHPHYKQYRLP